MQVIGRGFCVKSGLGNVKMDANNLGWFLCVTTEPGSVAMEASNWKRFLCDIWVGQVGNVCK